MIQVYFNIRRKIKKINNTKFKEFETDQEEKNHIIEN